MIDIYKASAGSGKTFTLTYRYLLLLLGEKGPDGRYHLDKEGRDRHRDILAITFTNKATEEMKRRIVHELAVIGALEPGWTKPSPYLKSLTEDLGCSTEELRDVAAKALKQLMFDFNFFNVSTIDTFFQSILRTFAREVDLTGNYEVELDTAYAITVAVARLMSDISSLEAKESRHSRLMHWVIQYMEDQALQGKRFNVFNRKSYLFGELVRVVGNMLGEDFDASSQAIRGYLDDGDRVIRFAESCYRGRKIMRQQTADAAARILERASEFDEPENVLSSNFCKALRKIASGNSASLTTIKRAAEVPDTALTAKSRKLIGPDGVDSLCPVIAEGCNEICRDDAGIAFLQLVTQNLFMLGLIGEVLKNMSAYCEENNLFLLSNTNDLLRRIIADDEAPVIYERLGVWINHYLIDEFQDTSRMQWTNLKPLLSESLSTGNDNLIIGDEKQCIYRFRNSAPELLHSAVQTDFPGDCRITGDTVQGNTNWRSSADIVRFNNTLFHFIGTMVPSAAGIYNSVVQQISPINLDRQGYVCLRKIEGKKPDFIKASLEMMAEDIKRQIASGYRPADIAVLTRQRDEAVAVIDYLFTLASDPASGFPRVNVVSDDSLAVSTSPAVRYIVSVLRYLTASDNAAGRKVSSRRIAAVLNRYEYIRTHEGGISPREALERAVDLESESIDGNLDGAATMTSVSLGSLVERIINDYVSPTAREVENLYISAFQDAVADFCDRGEGDIQSFLEWWDSSGCRATVSSPETDDALRVMTIHKSKGLEFACVHIPVANWALDEVRDMKWIKPDPLWFKGIVENDSDIPPLLPIRFSGSMLDTPLEGALRSIVSEIQLDQINVTYVAFTRAVDELIVHYNSDARIGHETIGTCIDNALGAMTPENVEKAWTQLSDGLPLDTPTALVAPDYSPDGETVTVGEPTAMKEKRKKELTALDSRGNIPMPVYSGNPDSTIWNDLTIETPLDYTRERDRGIILHAVMRRVDRPSDIPAAARRLASRGVLPETELQEVIDHLSAQVESPGAKPWFVGYNRVMAERTVIDTDGNTHRPDRVVWTSEGTVDVVDYKFGAPRPSEYARQVKRYMNLLRSVTSRPVRGFIWYLDTAEIVDVE